MAELGPDQEAALRRLRAAFGFIEILRVVNHTEDRDRDRDRDQDQDQDQDDAKSVEEAE
jgi:hypothetical protein